MTKEKLVTAIFAYRADAEQAFNSLLLAGYTRDDISVLMSDATQSRQFELETGTKAAQGASVGAATGGTIGAIIAGVAAIGTSLVLPGLGLIVAGPLAGALAGLGAGGAAGGLIGGLVGAGMPEHRAKAFEAGIRSGEIMLGVTAKSDDDAQSIESIFQYVGAESVKHENVRRAS